MNFDPSVWTDKELDELIGLWTEFESISKACKEINVKIKTLVKKNDSFKSEIQASTNRCNEITNSEKFVSINSAEEIVELSKNIKEARKQEDLLEKEIAKYKDELVELRDKKDNIMSKINDLNSKVQERKTDKKINIKGTVTVGKILNIKDFEASDVNYSKNSIISTEKTATIILKSSFKESQDQSVNLPEFVREKVNNSGLVKITENMTEEMLMLQGEIEERRNNYLASLEASKLAEQTESEILSDQSVISMSFINDQSENNVIDSEKDPATKENDEPNVPEENLAIPEDKKENIESVKSDILSKKSDNSSVDISLSESEMPEKEKLDSISEKVEPIKLDIPSAENAQALDSIVEPKSVISEEKQDSDKSKKVEPIKLDIPSVEEKSVNSSSTVKPLVVTSPENNAILGQEKVKGEGNKDSSIIKLNFKKNTIATAKPEKIVTISTIYQKKFNGNGINSVNLGFVVNSNLESVRKLIEFNKSKNITKENLNDSVSNIFGTTQDEVHPLKLSA